MKPKVMNLFTLMMVTCAFNVSIRNLSVIAKSGMEMFFFGLLALIIYYIPIATTSAELATGWPKMGGIAVWVKEAFGKRFGLFAIWLQWIFMNIAVIAMLYFIAGSLAYVYSPTLVNNKIYLICAILVIIWTFTFLNLKGLKISTEISMTFFIIGVLLPALFIISLSIYYLFQGNPIQVDTHFTVDNYFPSPHFATLVILIGFMRTFGGIEGSAVHANYATNPKRNYPIAIAFTVFVGFCVNIFGALALAMVIPEKDINLLGGVMSAFSFYFDKFHLKALIPVLSICVAIGQMGGFSTWLGGPVRGLLETALEGELPPFFQKVNKYNAPINLMILQGVFISITSSMFLLMSKDVNSSFWISVALSMMVYVTMYFLMILSCLVLRYKKPEVERTFKVPFLWPISIVGMGAMVFAFMMALTPPVQLPAENHTEYVLTLVIFAFIIFTTPFVIHRFKKPSWNPHYKPEEKV